MLPRTPQGITQWLWVLLVALLPLILGLPLLAWQAERSLQAQSAREVTLAVQQVTTILDNAANAARALAPLAGVDCADATLPLREQVTRNPYVRSTSLVAANRLYCSSLYGPFDEGFSLENYTDGRLRLFAADAVTPGRPLLVYREAAAGGSALATVDGQHLANALAAAEADAHMLLQVGPAWMTAQGLVDSAPLPRFASGQAQAASGRYPFSVYAGYDQPAPWHRLLGGYPTLALLAALGVAAGVVCYRQQRRAGSPRQELGRALDAGEFVPFFQTVVASTDGACTGAEVLMRWRHPRDGLVRPDLFIPYAEACGLIVPMTRSLMRQAAAALAPVAHSLEDGFHVGINVAAAHCRDPSLVADCEAFLAMFPPGRIQLVLELTERELVTPAPETLELFGRLRAMGVRIALDDFGTGHSSLSYLHQFRVDYLKIDQSFVAMIGSQALSRHILDSIIELCAKLELGVVAEGVETEEQQRYLAGHGVGYLQGYLFARPMPADVFLSHVRACRLHRVPVPLVSAAELG
ncbi:cyclic diguanylate phosphodiesterase [Pseudomonas sp. RIT-PI-S]|uniref:cyclic diguanylate phosphodiesterase n=1 Tax=Pseudomonas sp. RIT-PI-S TaxID=3035295 RepID=UPI0021D93F35|nr:cyclic diguanylate phosphodiesterase [Pseudomonas sp. RIT-PI-S]